MSSPSLTSALTYAYASTSKLMRSSKTKTEIRVYVEDEGDIMFWRQLLSSYDELYDFKISVFHCNDRDLSGKDCIMKAVREGKLILHSYMLACLDADYDLIIDDYHTYTNVLRTNPYVITTHWYAIENIKADPEHLSEYYNYCTLSDNCSIDFHSIVEDISVAYYELLLRLIICQSKDALKKQFTIDTFGDDLKECTYDDKNQILATAHSYIATRINALDTILSTYTHEFAATKKRLQENGIMPKNCYRMIKGHHWIDVIVIPLMTKLVDKEYQKMVNKKLSGIPSDSTYREQRQQITEHYNNNIGIRDFNEVGIKARIARLINDHIHNEDVEITTQILADIELAIKRDQILSVVEGLQKKKAQIYKIGNSKPVRVNKRRSSKAKIPTQEDLDRINQQS